MNPRLHISDDILQSSRAIANLILKESAKKALQSEQFNIAVSGGSTPRVLFDLLAMEFETNIPWQYVRVFWVDERCVEPTHPESNYGMTFDSLLSRSVIPGENVFRMKGEEVPEDEAERYQQVLLSELPYKNGFPVFDLILLGMGGDGHTASIFPNDMSLLDTEFSVGVGVHPISGQKRITLTGNTICNARKVAFLIGGTEKAGVLRQIIKNEPDSGKYPAAHVHDSEGNLDFFLDNAAASEL